MFFLNNNDIAVDPLKGFFYSHCSGNQFQSHRTTNSSISHFLGVDWIGWHTAVLKEKHGNCFFFLYLTFMHTHPCSVHRSQCPRAPMVGQCVYYLSFCAAAVLFCWMFSWLFVGGQRGGLLCVCVHVCADTGLLWSVMTFIWITDVSGRRTGKEEKEKIRDNVRVCQQGHNRNGIKGTETTYG